jgi:nitrogen fixation/metabolism regulation signal transduction histidine kinase
VAWGHRFEKKSATNLFENSLAACSDTVEIEISIQNREWDGSPATVIRYRDNGPGLSEAVRARIFEAFFTTKDTGTGLGMAIAKRVVDEHRGDHRPPHMRRLDLGCQIPRQTHGLGSILALRLRESTQGTRAKHD